MDPSAMLGDFFWIGFWMLRLTSATLSGRGKEKAFSGSKYKHCFCALTQSSCVVVVE